MGFSLLGKSLVSTRKPSIDASFSDPDHYGFRMAQLPHDLTMAPHSADAQEIVINQSIPGVSITGKVHCACWHHGSFNTIMICRIQSAASRREPSSWFMSCIITSVSAFLLYPT